MNQSNVRKKSLKDYELIIFDLDGTLYFQKPFRKKMLLFLAKHVLCHPSSLQDLFLIKRYREIREDWDALQHENKETTLEDLDAMQFAYVAREKKTSPERVKKAVQFFMLEAPLSILPDFVDQELAEVIKTMTDKGKTLAVYSDYPVADKLNSLGIQIKAQFTAADDGISCMKPDPKGLHYVLEQMGCAPENALMVGDRMEKDGMAAEANEVDYVILSSKKEERKGYLLGLFQ